MTSNPDIFVNPDPEGVLLVYTEDLVTAIAPGTQTQTPYINHLSSNGQNDAVFLITESEIQSILGREGEITSIGMQFERGSFTVLPGSFSI